MRLPYPVRAVAASVLRSVPVRVRSGPNAGLRWTLASAGRGCRAGTFERDRLAALITLARPGDHVWDLGAHKGYMSLALSRRVRPGGSVSAVEPSRQNLWFLERHLSWNDVDNARVIPAAVSDRDGSERFGGTGSTVQFHLGEGDETVRVARLATLREFDGLPQPDLIKMDIEGAESATLRDAGDVLGPDCVLFVSLHSRGLYEECRALLLEKGFRLFESAALARLGNAPQLPWAEDPELLAIGPARPIEDGEIRSMSLFAES